MSTIDVVIDLESDPPQALGNYVRTDEDTVLYRRPAGDNGYAPCDCVKVVAVEVFPQDAPGRFPTGEEFKRYEAEHGWAAKVADALTPPGLR